MLISRYRGTYLIAIADEESKISKRSLMTSVGSDLAEDEHNSYSKRSSASKFIELLHLYADLPRNQSAVQEIFILCCNPDEPPLQVIVLIHNSQ